MSFFKGVKLNWANSNITIQPDSNKNELCIEILGKYVQPIFIHYKGDFEEITIIFKPFGFNQFIRGDLLDFAPEYSQPFTLDDWLRFSSTLFEEETLVKKIEKLEEFLLDNFYEIENNSISKAIQYLEDFYMNYSIEKVAGLCGLTSKTYQRNFLKNITCPPSEIKRIARFRHSLNNRLLSKEIKSLTNLSYESGFYDQSYFIREYKKLTLLNPKEFFQTIAVLDENKMIWKIV